MTLPAALAEIVDDFGALAESDRVTLLLEECYRHAKVIGAWGDGTAALTALGLDGVPGVVSGDDAAAVLADVQALMAHHRVWERFPARA